MWQYNQTGELMHYGVNGMKWGVRRQQRRIEKANKVIAYREGLMKKNQKIVDAQKKLAKAAADDKADYEVAKRDIERAHKSTLVANKFYIAKAKAKIDKNYKKTSDYQQAVKDRGKQRVQMALAAGLAVTSIAAYTYAVAKSSS